MSLILATRNLHKIREIRAILKEGLPDVDLISISSYPDYCAPEETGSSFQENACLKAQNAAHMLNSWVLAEDSGLVVPALNGEPGIYSARYAGQDANDEDNRRKLLERIAQKKETFPQLDLSAYYQCHLVLAAPGGAIDKEVEASCQGTITQEPTGRGGFGYDPLFIKTDYGKSFAQLSESVKNCVSHRRKALDKLLPILRIRFSEG